MNIPVSCATKTIWFRREVILSKRAFGIKPLSILWISSDWTGTRNGGTKTVTWGMFFFLLPILYIDVVHPIALQPEFSVLECPALKIRTDLLSVLIKLVPASFLIKWFCYLTYKNDVNVIYYTVYIRCLLLSVIISQHNSKMLEKYKERHLPSSCIVNQCFTSMYIHTCIMSKKKARRGIKAEILMDNRFKLVLPHYWLASKSATCDILLLLLHLFMWW